MRLLLAHGGRLYRFLNIEASTRDGSLSIAVRRDGKSSLLYRWGTRPGEEAPAQIQQSEEHTKKNEITIHQSGRINFHELGRSIYVEPLTAITKVAAIYRYRIPRISRLTSFNLAPDAEDCEFDLNNLADEAHSFTILLAPEAAVPMGLAIKLGYLKRYALIVEHDAQPFIPPPEFSGHFVTLKPEVGTMPAQLMAEDQALIAYHQALHETNGLIIYGPNAGGVWQVVFAVPMRDAPKLKIEFDDPMLFVDEKDVERDSRAGTAMVRFKVRRRGSNAIVRTQVNFRSIGLDARL